MNRFLLFGLSAALLLALGACAPDDQAFNADALPSHEQMRLQAAMDVWNDTEPARASFSIDPAGGSTAIYADHRPHLGWHRRLPGGVSEISIHFYGTLLVTDKCRINIWVHELGHSISYNHNDHRLLVGEPCG